MKGNIKNNLNGTRVVISVLALVFSGAALAQSKPACLSPGAASKEIEIQIYSDQDPEFASANACPGNASAKDGDICLEINEKPDIKFTKKGADKADWEFVEIQLSGDGETWPGTLPPGAYSDFEFGSDEALNTGRPYWSQLGPNQMHIQNNNCHEFTVHYRLILRNTTTNKVVRLHPVMDNTGTQ